MNILIHKISRNVLKILALTCKKSCLSEIMKICDYKRSRSVFDL